MKKLSDRLRMVSNMIHLGEKISWGQETALMDEAADCIDYMRMRLVQIASGDYKACGHTFEDVAKDALDYATKGSSHLAGGNK